MRVLLLADNLVGWKVTEHLAREGAEIVGLVTHPPEIANYRDEIVRASGLDASRIFVGGKHMNSPEFVTSVSALRPDVALSIYWAYLLKPEFFTIPPRGTINFHCSLLPFNRGKNPNVWPLIEGTPAGVTLHYIDAGIDTGDIVAQREIPVDWTDTAQTIYERMAPTFIELFQETWPKILRGEIRPAKQDGAKATFHLAKDFKQLDEIDLDKQYTARELLARLRAKTFPPNPACFFRVDGRRIFVRVSLEEAPNEQPASRAPASIATRL
ncbi:MAG: hypothetical protein HY554_06675 [Elusimicrobia bacterium]|nr:hypothetical protein [Elusimicrobiota bacterium]